MAANNSQHGYFYPPVNPRGVAQRFGLRVGDRILAISGAPTHHMTHEQAKMEIIRSGNELDMFVQRNAMAIANDQPDSGPVQKRPERSTSMEESSEYRGYTNPNVQSRSFKILQDSLHYSDANEEGMILPEAITPGERLVTRSVNEGKKWREELMDLHPRNFSSAGNSPYRYETPDIQTDDQTRFAGSQGDIQQTVASPKIYDGLQAVPREIPKPQVPAMVDSHVFQSDRATEVQQPPQINYHERESKRPLKHVNYNFPPEGRQDGGYQNVEPAKPAPQQWSAREPQQFSAPAPQRTVAHQVGQTQRMPNNVRSATHEAVLEEARREGERQYVQPATQQQTSPEPQRPVVHRTGQPQSMSNKVISATHEAVMREDMIQEPERPIPAQAQPAVHHIEPPAREPVVEVEPEPPQPVVHHVQPPHQQPAQQAVPAPSPSEPSPQVSTPQPPVAVPQDVEPSKPSTKTSEPDVPKPVEQNTEQTEPLNRTISEPEPHEQSPKTSEPEPPKPLVPDTEPQKSSTTTVEAEPPKPVVQEPSEPEPLTPVESSEPPQKATEAEAPAEHIEIAAVNTDLKESVGIAADNVTVKEESVKTDIQLEAATDMKEVTVSEEAAPAAADTEEVKQVTTETDTHEVTLTQEHENPESHALVIDSEESAKSVVTTETTSDVLSESHSETFHFSTSIDMDGEVTEGIQITASFDDDDATNIFEINTDVSTGDTAGDEHETTVVIGSFSIDEGDEATETVDISADSDATFSIACV